MSVWNTTVYRRNWVRCVDAITGNYLSFSDDHIAVIRQNKGETVSVVTADGLAYEVEGTYEQMMEALGVKRSDDNHPASDGSGREGV